MPTHLSSTNTMAISATPKDLILVALSLFILHYLTKSLLLHRHNRAFAKSHGCKPPRRLPCGIFGLREFRLLAHAVNEGEIIEFVCSRFKPGWYTFVMSDMGLQVIRTIDPENIKTILATSFKDYSLGSIRRDASEPMLGHGIFTLDGEGWEYSRALLRPQFTREQVADVEMMDEHVGRMLELMQRGGKDGAVVDLQPWFFCLTLDTATEFMFGESAKSLLMGEDDQSGFAYSFKQAVAWILWKIQYHQISNMFTPRAMKVANRDCHRFVDEYVHKALNRDKFPLAENLRGRYVFLDAVAQTNRNPKALRDQMLNVLLAGRDTTAGMLG